MNIKYDIIVIGAGSGGLAISLFAAKIGLKVLLVERTEQGIGGDCLNYGCVPSKALIHLSKIVNSAHTASRFGLSVSEKPDTVKLANYIKNKQDIIRKHENAAFLRQKGMEVVLGDATFSSHDSILVNSKLYRGKKIILATGSRPSRLSVQGIELVKQYNNENIFDLSNLPHKFLMVGGGPIGVEMGQALSRLNCQVTIIHQGKHILPRDPVESTNILYSRLTEDGINFYLNAAIEQFTSPNSALVKTANGGLKIETFDAVFVAIGRTVSLIDLSLEKAGVKVVDGKIVVNKYLQTTNKNIYVSGDAAGSLKLSHAAEQHSRIIINNLFSPVKKSLSIDHMSWVTFTDPEVATFGLSEKDLQERQIKYEKINFCFKNDDRACIDDYQYGNLVLFLTKGGLLRRRKVLGGSMVCPGAGELIQELILVMTEGINVNALFSKIYPYPVASRVNQSVVVSLKEKQITHRVKKLMKTLFAILN